MPVLHSSNVHRPDKTFDPPPPYLERMFLVYWLVRLLLAVETEAPVKAKVVHAAAPPAAAVDFVKDVRPIFERRCQPCHFEGGKMYARLPFDKPETITKLGEKVFTRIKDERDQAVIRAFLASQQSSR